MREVKERWMGDVKEDGGERKEGITKEKGKFGREKEGGRGRELLMKEKLRDD